MMAGAVDPATPSGFFRVIPMTGDGCEQGRVVVRAQREGCVLR